LAKKKPYSDKVRLGEKFLFMNNNFN